MGTNHNLRPVSVLLIDRKFENQSRTEDPGFVLMNLDSRIVQRPVTTCQDKQRLREEVNTLKFRFGTRICQFPQQKSDW